jgi:hypothetical protein
MAPKENTNMARINQQAWDIVDKLDSLRADFIDSFLRNGEPKGEEAKELLEEFTGGLKKLLNRCERIGNNLSAGGKRRAKESREEASKSGRSTPSQSA